MDVLFFDRIFFIFVVLVFVIFFFRMPFNRAEREGFEPSKPLSQFTRFPSVRLQPLGHLSKTTLGKIFRVFWAAKIQKIPAVINPHFFILQHQTTCSSTIVRKEIAKLQYDDKESKNPTIDSTCAVMGRLSLYGLEYWKEIM